MIERSKIRKEYGADISIISIKEAQKIDPNINSSIKCAAFCEMDGYVSANQTGNAYSKALKENKVKILENYDVSKIDYHKNKYVIIFKNGEKLTASSLILATGCEFRENTKVITNKY